MFSFIQDTRWHVVVDSLCTKIEASSAEATLQCFSIMGAASQGWPWIHSNASPLPPR